MRVAPAEGTIDDLDDVDDVGYGVAIDVGVCDGTAGRGNTNLAIRVWIVKRRPAAKCHVDRMLNVEDVADPVAFRADISSNRWRDIQCGFAAEGR